MPIEVIKLDGRRNYKMIDGELCQLIEPYTDSCSGCYETVDGQNVFGYPYDEKAGCFLGSGCEECGYTGKRRYQYWMPIKDAIMAEKIEKEMEREFKEIEARTGAIYRVSEISSDAKGG
jgi:hypothetical protein